MYLKVDRILAETIKAGLTPRQIIRAYEQRFDDEGILVRDNQLHMVVPKNNFPVYSAGFAPRKTHLSIDSHGQTKGARPRSVETYFGARIGSLGPDWSKDIPPPTQPPLRSRVFFLHALARRRRQRPISTLVGS